MAVTEQGTPEWERQRLGKVTASRMGDVIKRTKAGWSESRRKYMIELIAERLTGMRADPYLSSAMLWGIETEPVARAAYEKYSGDIVEKAGFVEHPHIPMSGASPDGYLHENGLVEIKCPETRTHIGYMIEKAVPDHYIAQIQWQLACTEREWCDFVSFDPRMPERLRLHTIRVHRVAEISQELEKLVAEFLREMDRTIEVLTGLSHVESSDIAADLKVSNLFPNKAPRAK